MKKVIILFIFSSFLVNIAFAQRVGLIILKSSGTPCSSSSNSHNIIRDWFEEILIDSLNNQYVFGDSIEVKNLYNYSNEENLKQYYQNVIKASYNISDIKTINHQKLKKETFEKINMRFIGEIEITCLSDNNYFILKLFDLKKIVEMRYRYLLPLNALSNKMAFKEEMGVFINTVFYTNKEMNLDIPSFIWSFNIDKTILSLDKDIDVRIKYSKQLDHNIEYEWKIYRLNFLAGFNSFLIEPHLISDKIEELHGTPLNNYTLKIDDLEVEIELINTIHNKYLNFDNIDFSGSPYYYIVGSKRNIIYDISMMTGKTILIGTYNKNVYGLDFGYSSETDYGETTSDIRFKDTRLLLSLYYQRNCRIKNLVFGFRTTYVIFYKKSINKESTNRSLFHSLLISSGPLIGLGEFKKFTIDPFLGLGIAKFDEDYENVITFQLGLKRRFGKKTIIGLSFRYIKAIESHEWNLFYGLTISKPTYRIK